MKYAFSYIGKQDFGTVYYNTHQVNPKDFHSFWDFLHPKWKGKISAADMRRGGPGGAPMRFLYFNPKLGPEYIRRLFSEMDITLFRDRRQGVDWLATGKYSICFFCSDIGQAQLQGLPVDAFGLLKEGAGLSASTGNVGFVNRAPHPNAAKVFLNWLLSREGQITMQKEYAKAMTGNSNSLRIDIPKDIVPAHERLREGIDYIEVDSWERRGSMEDIYKVVNEALAKAKK
jgi:iron(III) transport system substrate-binding protein